MIDSTGTRGRTPDMPWIEVTDPLADAMTTLAHCIHKAPHKLRGASIAVTDSGSLLLNQPAWTLCGSALRELPGLKSRETRLDETKVVRFLLLAA